MSFRTHIVVLIGLAACISATSALPVRDSLCYRQWPNGVLIESQPDDSVEVHFPNGSSVFVNPGECNSSRQPSNGEVESEGQSWPLQGAGRIDSPDYYSGWVEWGGYLVHDNITEMTASWVVPPPPPHYNILTTVFLFAGLEEKGHGMGSTDIIQPVLQYGHSGCGGGDHWSVASFYVPGIIAHCGKVLRVKQGDTVFANMSYNHGDDTWTVTSVVRGVSGVVQESVLRVKVAHAYHWASLTLEGIRVYHCTAYPGGNSTLFTNATMKVLGSSVTPHWKSAVDYHDCGQTVEIEEEGNVRLFYNSTNSEDFN